MEQSDEQIAAAIAALEAQRAVLGDAVIEMALTPLRNELHARQARAARQAPAQQLKQVSVLFVDVVGSTAIGQQLDPEEIHAVMDGALERFTAIVQAEHGRVLQYTGDGMLAAFGTEDAREDDVESAVRAGLGILEEAKRQAPDVRRRHGVGDFNVRAGVHTGTVLLGGGVDAEGSIRGATVNVAARMEQSAPPGRLRISHDSYRHVHGLFDVQEQPPISVKGVEQPMRSYLVERVRPRAFRAPTRGVDGVHTPLVGRGAERALLRAAHDSVRCEARMQAVAVVGDAGLGKSRLLGDFLEDLDKDDCWLLLGRAHPRSAVHPYGLLREMLVRQCQIGEADAAEVARAKLVGALGPLFTQEDGEAPVHLLGHLIGLDFADSPHVSDVLGDERLFRRRAFDAALLCLRRLAQSHLLVVVLDDLHWADAGTLDFLKEMLAQADLPLLCLLMTRPTLFEHEHMLWLAEPAAAHLRRINLAPLDAASSQQLAERLLDRLADVPPELRTLLTRGAEGNPYYMEELVKMLIDDGVIVVEAEGWRVLPDKLVHARVPSTLAGVLQARLDALPAPERHALQQAAVVGHVFWDRALAAIDPGAAELLPLLVRRRLVVPHDAPAFDDTHEYAFQHHLLQQVTYESVLKAPRREAHARVGAFWSERAEVGDAGGVDPAKCRALAEAQHHRCEADAADCAVWFDAQFSPYLEAYAARVLQPLAVQVIGVCERHFGQAHPQTAKALVNLARAHLQQGRADQAEPPLRRALSIHDDVAASTDPLDKARALAVLGGCHSGRGDLLGAEPLFRRALEIREQVLGAEHPLTLGTLDYLAKATLELGRLDEAEALMRRVLTARERVHGAEHAATAFAMTALGEVLAKRGAHAQAVELIGRALELQRKVLPEEHAESALSMWHLAESLRALRRLHEAEALGRRALQIWESVFGPEHEWTAWGLIGLAETLLALGAAREAAELAARAVPLIESAYGEVHPVLASTLDLQGRALVALDEVHVAQGVLARARAIRPAGAQLH